MTETTQQAATQAANGQAPGPGAPPPAEPDTGEKWLGVLVIAAGIFLIIIGIDRATGGALSGRFFSEEANAGG